MFRCTIFFGDDWQGIWIPFVQLVTAFDCVAFFDEQLGTIAQLKAGALNPLLIKDAQLHVTTHDQGFAIRIFQSHRHIKCDFTWLTCFLE